MGSCLCKENTRSSADSDSDSSQDPSMVSETAGAISKRTPPADHEPIEDLIVAMIHHIGSYQDPESDIPTPLVKLSMQAETDDGWCGVVTALLRHVSLNETLGPSAITIIFDDCPLPSRESVVRYCTSLLLCEGRCKLAYEDEPSTCYERNLLVLLSCIAEKFAGPQALEVLSTNTLNYLVGFLMDEHEPKLVVFALIALEKFARIAECKVLIEECFANKLLHPLLPLECHNDDEDLEWRQVGFCAQWLLDNTFLFQGRRFSFETVTTGRINAMLNSRDVSEYLKISPDGLEGRCDSHSFESVRATFRVDSGVWFYEAKLVTSGVMQIGWATKSASFKNHDGYGVGDDPFSLAYDGCRRLIWHQAVASPTTEVEPWQPGDILGCLIDIGRQEAIFSINGKRLPVCSDIFRHTRQSGVDLNTGRCSEGFYPAASFMAYQQCRFNFGAEDFAHPPTDREFQVINEAGKLTAEQKKVIPRRILLQEVRLEQHTIEGRCGVCLNEVGSYGFLPCKHGGFCYSCVKLLKVCPLCRRIIQKHFIMAL